MFSPITSFLPHNHPEVVFCSLSHMGHSRLWGTVLAQWNDQLSFLSSSGQQFRNRYTYYPWQSSFPGISLGPFWKHRFLVTLGLGVTHNVPLLHCVRDVRLASCLPQLHVAVLDELMGLCQQWLSKNPVLPCTNSGALGAKIHAWATWAEVAMLLCYLATKLAVLSTIFLTSGGG